MKGKNSADEEEQKSRTLDSVNELQVITTIFIQKKLRMLMLTSNKNIF